MDLVGPFEVESYGVAKYLLVILDACTSYMWAYPISRKSSVSDAVRSWAAEIKSDPRAKAQKLWIQTVRTDRGGEFLSNEFQSFCQEHNIKHTVTAPYTPEQSGPTAR
jgi:transposase InsO family protein